GIVHCDDLGAAAVVSAVAGGCPDPGDGVVLVGARAGRRLGGGLNQRNRRRRVAVVGGRRGGRGRDGVALHGRVGWATGQDRRDGIVHGDDLGAAAVVAAVVGGCP